MRDADRYRADPRAALVDCAVAATTLGWQPVHYWAAPNAAAAPVD
ncbi:MAG TPA: hypothetical protein VKU77_34995 [Streptosporangiaceae bacterium]|nr:hypothetical protein [Streptosporangiaceae bacterium]